MIRKSDINKDDFVFPKEYLGVSLIIKLKNEVLPCILKIKYIKLCYETKCDGSTIISSAYTLFYNNPNEPDCCENKFKIENVEFIDKAGFNLLTEIL